MLAIGGEARGEQTAEPYVTREALLSLCLCLIPSHPILPPSLFLLRFCKLGQRGVQLLDVAVQKILDRLNEALLGKYTILVEIVFDRPSLLQAIQALVTIWKIRPKGRSSSECHDASAASGYRGDGECVLLLEARECRGDVEALDRPSWRPLSGATVLLEQNDRLKLDEREQQLQHAAHDEVEGAAEEQAPPVAREGCGVHM
mmetsp:Transcript_4140/g.8978  ORF Transcript_4140/g.8978 Transcript_4140/m.8978 type:complete len:202 (-) Transcript_4140:330-935(-)